MEAGNRIEKKKQAFAETDQVRGHARRRAHKSIHGGTKGKQRKRMQLGTKANLYTTSNPKNAPTRTYTYSHTQKPSTKAAQEEKPRCEGWRWLGSRRRRTVGARQRQVRPVLSRASCDGTRDEPRFYWSRSETQGYKAPHCTPHEATYATGSRRLL